jgi:hypothetical protein
VLAVCRQRHEIVRGVMPQKSRIRAANRRATYNGDPGIRSFAFGIVDA